EKYRQKDKPENLMALILELVEGLRQIHKHQVIHRDIKPENIMVNLNSFEIKYIDFGTSCHEKDCLNVGFGGTLKYVAPEIIKNEKHTYTFEQLLKTDYWSLGMTLWQLIEIYHPYNIWKLKMVDLLKKCNHGNADEV